MTKHSDMTDSHLTSLEARVKLQGEIIKVCFSLLDSYVARGHLSPSEIHVMQNAARAADIELDVNAICESMEVDDA